MFVHSWLAKQNQLLVGFAKHHSPRSKAHVFHRWIGLPQKTVVKEMVGWRLNKFSEILESYLPTRNKTMYAPPVRWCPKLFTRYLVLGSKLSTHWNCYLSWYIESISMKSLKGTHLYFVRCKYVPPPPPHFKQNAKTHMTWHQTTTRHLFQNGKVVKNHPRT